MISKQFISCSLTSTIRFIDRVNRTLRLKIDRDVSFCVMDYQNALVDSLFLVGAYLILVSGHNPMDIWAGMTTFEPIIQFKLSRLICSIP